MSALVVAQRYLVRVGRRRRRGLGGEGAGGGGEAGRGRRGEQGRVENGRRQRPIEASAGQWEGRAVGGAAAAGLEMSPGVLGEALLVVDMNLPVVMSHLGPLVLIPAAASTVVETAPTTTAAVPTAAAAAVSVASVAASAAPATRPRWIFHIRSFRKTGARARNASG